MNTGRRYTAAIVLSAVVVLLWAAGCARRPETAPGGTPGPGADAPANAAPEQPTDSKEAAEVDWTLTSPDFEEGGRIPTKNTADGEDASPQLDWTTPPEGAVELALICDDPDAPVGIWNHWLLYGLSPDVTGLPGGLPKDAEVASPELMQGVNSFRKTGYGGPAPPKGKPHRYRFTLYALSAPLGLKPGATKAQVVAALEDKTIAQVTLEGVYSR